MGQQASDLTSADPPPLRWWCEGCPCRHQQGVLRKYEAGDVEPFMVYLSEQIPHKFVSSGSGRQASAKYVSNGSGRNSHGSGRQVSLRLASKGSSARHPRRECSTDNMVYLSEDALMQHTSSYEGAEPDSPSIRHILLIPKIQTAMRRFRGQMARSNTLHDVDFVNGVYVQNVYDFYDTATNKIRVRKMYDDVLHSRSLRLLSADADSSGNSEDPEPSSPKSTAHSQTSNSSDRVDSPKWVSQLKFMSADQAKVTQWAVIVAKLLNTHVIDFTTVVSKIKTNKALQGSSSYTVMNGVFERAKLVCKNAIKLSRLISRQQDTYDHETWEDMNLLEFLFGPEYTDAFMLLANSARKLFASQPVFAQVPAPARVFGDIHGQLRDLLLLFSAFGSPARADPTNFVFNGDFVDRGNHQLEVIGILFAMKVLLPDKVWLIRGNHEDRSMNDRYGFKEECSTRLRHKCGTMVYNHIQKAFEQLPVAGLVARRVLVVHGGIGDGAWTLNDLSSIKRPLVLDELGDDSTRWILNLFWSDPIEEDCQKMQGVFGVHASPRGKIASQFAWDVTKTFCARNGLGLIVRSHQSKQNSLGFDIMHDRMLIRVFSARDYENHGNDGAVLLIEEPDSASDKVTVRPQVLRSVTKCEDEEINRQFEDNADCMEARGTEREALALTRATQRRKSLRRSSLP